MQKRAPHRIDQDEFRMGIYLGFICATVAVGGVLFYVLFRSITTGFGLIMGGVVYLSIHLFALSLIMDIARDGIKSIVWMRVERARGYYQISVRGSISIGIVLALTYLFVSWSAARLLAKAHEQQMTTSISSFSQLVVLLSVCTMIPWFVSWCVFKIVFKHKVLSPND